MFAPVRCCFDVMFLLFASLFALPKYSVTDLREDEQLSGLLVCS